MGLFRPTQHFGICSRFPRAERVNEEYLCGEYRCSVKPSSDWMGDLELSVRARNALRRNGLWHIEDLLELRPEQLAALPGVGKTIAAEIVKKLKEQP